MESYEYESHMWVAVYKSDFGKEMPRPLIALLMEFSASTLAFICDGFRHKRHAVFNAYVGDRDVYCVSAEMKPEKDPFGRILCGACLKCFDDAETRMMKMNKEFLKALNDPINGRF